MNESSLRKSLRVYKGVKERQVKKVDKESKGGRQGMAMFPVFKYKN